jgi:hypothetical protein
MRKARNDQGARAHHDPNPLPELSMPKFARYTDAEIKEALIEILQGTEDAHACSCGAANEKR